jgi:hypothetical protein
MITETHKLWISIWRFESSGGSQTIIEVDLSLHQSLHRKR